MDIIHLKQEEYSAAIDLAWRVFTEFEAALSTFQWFLKADLRSFADGATFIRKQASFYT